MTDILSGHEFYKIVQGCYPSEVLIVEAAQALLPSRAFRLGEVSLLSPQDKRTLRGPEPHRVTEEIVKAFELDAHGVLEAITLADTMLEESRLNG